MNPIVATWRAYMSEQLEICIRELLDAGVPAERITTMQEGDGEDVSPWVLFVDGKPHTRVVVVISDDGGKYTGQIVVERHVGSLPS